MFDEKCRKTKEIARYAKEETKLITDIYKTTKHRVSKLVFILIILTFISYVFLGVINQNVIFAAQTRESYSSKINNYPGYKELIDNLKKSHPNWNFTIFYTGLDWSQVIKNETTACHGRNVVPASRPSSWKCSVCGETPRGGTSWRCASEAAVSYYMDPRNWLNDTYIFEFENLSYNGEIQTIEGVKKIIADMGYMQGDTIKYTTTDGTTATINKSYAQVIMEAASEAGISPYHLASRLRQEQGAGSRPGSTATGTYSGYVGYYNYLNIKASGSTDAQVIASGLQHAQKNGWTNPEISIKEGTKVLAKNYINDGQDTLYLQKFDVDNSDGTLYYFQYMQNVSASVTEGEKVKSTYESLGLIDSSIEFIIPVYENMPETICREPVDAGIVTQNVKIKGTNVNVRNGASTSASIIATVNTGDVLLRIEVASSSSNGIYWDKVVLPNGKKGYVSRSYLVEIADVTNCNDTVIANTSVNLRNGPGTTSTTIITTLIKGQVLTRIEKDKYNLDGYVWDRVKLSDGRQGYIAQQYISTAGSETENGGTEKNELIKVICNSGLKVREAPGTNQKVLTYLDKNDVLTRTQAGASNANGYTWDKVVTSDGIEGYIARGDSKEQYIQVVNSNNSNSNPSTPTTKNDKFKLEDSNLVCEPDTSVETIKEKYTNKNIVVKDSSGKVVSSGNVGTGYTITIDNKTYTIVKMGDINGDGVIDAVDLLKLRRVLLGKDKIDGVYKESANTYKDESVDAVDLLKIRKHLLKTDSINI